MPRLSRRPVNFAVIRKPRSAQQAAEYAALIEMLGVVAHNTKGPGATYQELVFETAVRIAAEAHRTGDALAAADSVLRDTLTRFEEGFKRSIRMEQDLRVKWAGRSPGDGGIECEVAGGRARGL